eukprot:scaffold3840_cov47-Phaeocystis_antarctica.AAC.2
MRLACHCLPRRRRVAGPSGAAILAAARARAPWTRCLVQPRRRLSAARPAAAAAAAAGHGVGGHRSSVARAQRVAGGA